MKKLEVKDLKDNFFEAIGKEWMLMILLEKILMAEKMTSHEIVRSFSFGYLSFCLVYWFCFCRFFVQCRLSVFLHFCFCFFNCFVETHHFLIDTHSQGFTDVFGL